MKRTKKILALVLTIAMCFTLVSTMAFAEEPQHLKYLAIGDSTSQGYMIPEYYDGWSGLQPVLDHERIGIGTETDADGNVYFENCSHPYLMYHYLKDTLGKNMDRSDFYQYTLQGMRTNELYYVLDPENAVKTADDFCKQRAGEWYETAFAGWYNDEPGYWEYNNPTDAFTNAIEVADLITFDLGMNSFGNYLIDRLLGIINDCEDNYDGKNYAKDTFDTIYNQLDGATKLACQTLDKTLKSLLGKLPQDNPDLTRIVNALSECVMYSYASHCLYFDKCMDIIYDLNPDVDLIVMSMYNGLPNNNFVVNLDDGTSISIDFGKVMQTIFDAMDNHATAINKHANQYKFADCDGVETFMMDMADGPSESTMKALKGETCNSEFVSAWHVLDPNDPASVANFETNIAKLMSMRDLDVMGVKNVLGNALDCNPMNAFLDFDNATDAEKTAAYVMTLTVCRGFGTHPSAQGCLDKFEAFKAAYNSPLKASAYATKGALDIGKDVADTVWSAIKAPVLEAIANVFDNIGSQFQTFLETIAQSIENIIMQFFPIKLK